MTSRDSFGRISRRTLLRSAAAAGAGAVATGALAQDALLESLIEETQQREPGQSFDANSRTVAMPKASLPTLSPATVQHTEQAIAQYDRIVASGGWPEVAR